MPELIDAVIEDERWHDFGLQALAETAATATLTHLGLDPAQYEIAILGCDDVRIAALNQTFRNKGLATNVLSWPAFDLAPDRPGNAPKAPPPGSEQMPEFLGDIAIAMETCVKEAKAASKRVEDHTLHLLVHGTLHLLGYDHITDADAEKMEALEVAILAKLGLANPYLV